MVLSRGVQSKVVNTVPEVVSVWSRVRYISVPVNTGVPFWDYHYFIYIYIYIYIYITFGKAIVN
jgi:hypothetical protein